MAVQMDKPSDISSRERAQRLYKKNVELENSLRKSAQARVPSDPNIWQQMRENYEAIILEDHAFAEQHEIELSLWLLHHKKIDELRALYNATYSSNVSSTTQNGNGGPARPDRLARIRTQFKTFLSEATGFYHELMLKIRAKYGLPLDYFSDDSDTQSYLSKDTQRFTDIKKGLISCHRCLIYLGDLARYKGQYGDGDSRNRDFVAACSYYMQASSLWPSGGNPHHQLALVAAYHDDEFLAIYRYFRSLAVESPFATARDNLIIAFERNRINYSQLIADSKTSSNKVAATRMSGKGKGRGEARGLVKGNRNQASSVKEKAPSILETLKAFNIKFVRANGILYTRTSQETFADVLSMAKNDFLVLLSAGSDEQYNFGSDSSDCGLFIVRLVAILIFTVHNVNRESENQSYAEILQRSVLLQNAYTAIFELMGHVIQKCLQLHDLMSSYLLPGILVFVEWLACHPDVATCSEEGETQLNARRFFWTTCTKFFNKLLSSGFLSNEEEDTCFFNMSQYEEGETTNRLALWEDLELRGFLPLLPAQQILDFSKKHGSGNGNGNDSGVKEKIIRIQRIIAAGKVFSNVVRVGQKRLYFDPQLKQFILGTEPQVCPVSVPSTPMVDSLGKESLVEEKASPRASEPIKVSDLEDEEEVIVFKPSVTDKQLDAQCPSSTSYEDLGLVTDSSKGLGVCDKAMLASPNINLLSGVSNEILHNGLGTTLSPSIPVPYSTSQNYHPIQLTTNSWVSDPKACLGNGFKNMNLKDKNGVSMNHQNPSDHYVSLQSAALSLPFSHSNNLNTNNFYPIPVSEPVVSSKLDHIISSGTEFNVFPIKSKPMLPVGSRKNPVSRPIRHTGPPPGFSPSIPQLEPSLKDGNPMMDDYSWLDGYQMPSSTKQDEGFNIYKNLNQAPYDNVGKWNATQGPISFPFPGKQGSVIKAPFENNHLWEQKGNQQTMSLQGQQSLWEGRFLV